MRKMKDSGVEWIGEIPEDWEVSKIKNFFKVQLVKMLQPQQKDITDTLESYLCAANLGNNHLKYEPIKQMWFSETDKGTYSIRKGDLLVVEGGDVGSCALVMDDVSDMHIQNALHRVRPIGIVDVRVLKYLLMVAKDTGHIDLICNKATISHFSKEKFISLEYLVPSNEEPHRIADFLDRKCAQIDTIIAKQQEVIEKLKLYKQSVITEAVTKGLAPDVPMKDSRIAWIGKIPTHWKLSHIGNLAEMGSGGTPDRKKSEYWEAGTIPWMASGEINYEYINDTCEKITEDGMKNSNAKLLPINTVMLGLIGQGKTKGLTAILKINSTCNQNLAFLIPNPSYLHFSYLFYCFKAMYGYMRGLVGESQEGIYLYFLKKLHISLPDINEQQIISKYLDDKSTKIEFIIEKKQALIDKLTQYKKSLIYEAVTGKMEV